MGRPFSKLYKDEVIKVEPDAAPQPPDLESPLSDVQYNQYLKEAISETFVSYVIPLNVLHVFHKYNRRVLVRQDLSMAKLSVPKITPVQFPPMHLEETPTLSILVTDFVKAQTIQLGEVVGSRALLDRLVIYEDWFHCLLQSLRDSDVMLSHVAYQFESIREALDESILKQDEKSNDSQGPESQPQCEQPHRTQLREAMKLKVKLDHMTKECHKEREMREKYEEELHSIRAAQSKPDSAITDTCQEHSTNEDLSQRHSTDLKSVRAENERLQQQLQTEREKVKNMELEILEKQSHLDAQRSIAYNEKKNKSRKLRPLVCLGQVKQRSKGKHKEKQSATNTNKARNKENHHSPAMANKDEPNLI